MHLLQNSFSTSESKSFLVVQVVRVSLVLIYLLSQSVVKTVKIALFFTSLLVKITSNSNLKNIYFSHLIKMYCCKKVTKQHFYSPGMIEIWKKMLMCPNQKRETKRRIYCKKYGGKIAEAIKDREAPLQHNKGFFKKV